MITYTWRITPPTVRDEGEFTDVIKSVGWSVSAVDGGSKAMMSGTEYFGTPTNPALFTQFNSVSHDTVKSWILNSLGMTEAQVFKKLERQIVAEQCEIKVPEGW